MKITGHISPQALHPHPKTLKTDQKTRMFNLSPIDSMVRAHDALDSLKHNRSA